MCFVMCVGDLDDLEFWLSTDATPAKQTAESASAPAAVSEDTPTTKASKKKSKKRGGAKTEPTPPEVSRVIDEPEVGEEVEPSEVVKEEEGKKRKKRGEKVSSDNDCMVISGESLVLVPQHPVF